jgi:folate-binding Fe-S cluster repair protein YgfZ
MINDWHELYFFSDEPNLRRIINNKEKANKLEESELEELLQELAVPIVNSKISTADSNWYALSLRKCGAKEIKLGPTYYYVEFEGILRLEISLAARYLIYRGDIDFDKLKKLIYN